MRFKCFDKQFKTLDLFSPTTSTELLSARKAATKSQHLELNPLAAHHAAKGESQ